MRTLDWWWVLGVWAVTATARLGADSAPPWLTVAVRVYDSTGPADSGLSWALQVADTRLESAGIDVRWLQCHGVGGVEPGECGHPHANHLAIRLVRQRIARADLGYLPLGDALIDRATGVGVLGTVYRDRVERLAESARVNSAILLGDTIVHELGHLLMGTTLHNQAGGLMRPIWTPLEMQRGDEADWRFTSSDIAAMRAAIGARVGSLP